MSEKPSSERKNVNALISVGGEHEQPVVEKDKRIHWRKQVWKLLVQMMSFEAWNSIVGISGIKLVVWEKFYLDPTVNANYSNQTLRLVTILYKYQL